MKNSKIAEQYRKRHCPYFEDNCPRGEDTSIDVLNRKLDCACAKFLAFKDASDPEIVAKELKAMNVTATEKMGIMLSMQKIFAGKFHKIDNLTKDEIDHWTNSYLVCIEDEIMEAEEFLDIYPTKIKEFNLKEYRKELIDVLHFMMDGMLVAGMTYEDLKTLYFGDYLGNTDLLDFAMKLEQVNVDQIMDEKQNLYLLNYLLRDIRLVRQCISWKHWKKPSATIDNNKIFTAYTNMFKHLLQAFLATGMTSTDVYNVYIQKNIENVLRQKYGYLTGKISG